MGGVEAMERRAIERCNALYSEFDRNTVFRAVVEEGSRSRMNIPFLLAEGYEELEKEFWISVNLKHRRRERSPFGGWFPCFYLQCLYDGRCKCFDCCHAGI